MKTILFINHDTKMVFMYPGISTKKEAKELGLKTQGEMYKCKSREEAIEIGSDWTDWISSGYGFNIYVK